MAGHSQFKNIMHRKGAQDARRARAFAKIIREITVSARQGSPDPNANPRLRAAVIAARQANMPKDTVERVIDKRKGSLQYWVKDCKLYRELQGQTPPRPSEWSHQLSVMKMFDVLIMNKDRNAQNFLVDGDWHMVLIDHSRAFIGEDDIGKDEKRLPVQFDRKLVEKLRSLDAASLEAGLGKLLMGGQVKSLIKRRDALLAYLDGLVAERGEARVFFD